MTAELIMLIAVAFLIFMVGVYSLAYHAASRPPSKKALLRRANEDHAVIMNDYYQATAKILQAGGLYGLNNNNNYHR